MVHILYSPAAKTNIHDTQYKTSNDINGDDESVDDQWQTPISFQCLLMYSMHMHGMNEVHSSDEKKNNNNNRTDDNDKNSSSTLQQQQV